MHRFSRASVIAVLLVWLVSCGTGGTTPVDSIWSARWVVTMDPARRVIENGAVAIRGDRIVAVGPALGGSDLEALNGAQHRDRGCDHAIAV